jgi:hypothetical protein
VIGAERDDAPMGATADEEPSGFAVLCAS